jgi:two-component system nitrogen regulation response regulator NtrX
MPRVLIIDDERSIRNTLRDILEYERFEVDEAKDGEEGLEKIKASDYEVILCDVKMPKLDGMELLERALQLKPESQFIMISGHANIDTAVEATKKGAYDFIQKPPDLNRLLVTVRNALDKSSLVTETKTLRRRISKTRQILGESGPIKLIRETVARVAPTEARVLITGPNGTGKELVARWLHEQSQRADGPLVEVNCAAIPAELIESELFGHEKGAFTSAVKQRIGKFEQSHGGTLFLDEIGDMSLSAQAKVLRALQENRITRVGGDKEISLDVRVVAATNKDLSAEIAKGNFREDLYHRLAVIVVRVPPLSDRISDVPELAQAFLSEICEEYGYPPKRISPAALELLMQHSWTGNVRELHNVIERLAIFADREISEHDVLTYAAPNLATGNPRTSAASVPSAAPVGLSEDWFDAHASFQDFKDAAEAEFIRRKLIKNQWNVTKTAEEIDIQRSHLYNKIEKFGLQREAK